jgi:hypothetical protein
MNYLAAAFLRRRFFGAAAGAAAFLRRFGAAFLAAAFLRRFGAAFLAAAFLRRFGAAAFTAAFLRRFFGAAAGAAAFLRRFFGAVFFAAATYFSYRNGSDPSPKPVACISVTEMRKFRQYIVANIGARVADYFFRCHMHIREILQKNIAKNSSTHP